MKIFYLIIAFYTISACGNSQNEIPEEKWFSGGTLHKSKLIEWQSATEKNKLATCADFVANMKDYEGDLVLMKKDAIDVMECLNETAQDPSFSDQQTSEMALSCLLILGI